MKMPLACATLLTALLATAAWAQSAPTPPLNLRLDPSSVPAASRSAAAAPDARTSVPPAMDRRSAAAADLQAEARQPGVYYGDTSGIPVADESDAPACDDSTYNQPRVHGSVGMGVMAGDHVGGNYQTGTVNVSRALGSCEEPRGGVSVSIGVGNSRFHHHR